MCDERQESLLPANYGDTFRHFIVHDISLNKAFHSAEKKGKTHCTYVRLKLEG